MTTKIYRVENGKVVVNIYNIFLWGIANRRVYYKNKTYQQLTNPKWIFSSN